MPTEFPGENEWQSELAGNVKALCAFGSRFPGSGNDARAADWIAQRLVEYGLDAKVQRFPMMGWRLNRPAALTICHDGAGPDPFDCLPLVYSGSTPNEGVTGRLEYVGKRPLGDMRKFRIFERDNFRWDKYAIVDADGQHLAHIISRDYPERAAVAVWGALSLPFTIPTVLVAGETGRLLASWRGKEVYATLSIDSSFDPTAVSYNVIGAPSESSTPHPRDTILVTAHYDSQYNTVGAVDNATGVACLLALAKRRIELTRRHHLRFVAFGAEEVGLIGAKHYETGLAESGELSRIAAVLNLDMLGCNQPNWVHVSDHEAVIEGVRRAAANLDLAAKYGGFELVTPPWPTGDQDPYYEAGIPVVSFTWKGSLYRQIHCPGDTEDQVDWAVLNDSFHLAGQVLIELSERL